MELAQKAFPVPYFLMGVYCIHSNMLHEHVPLSQAISDVLTWAPGHGSACGNAR